MRDIAKAIANDIVTNRREDMLKGMNIVANKIKQDFMMQAQIYLDAYYAEYPKPPRQYNRTDNLRNNAVIPFRRNRKGAIDVGVEFSPEKMSKYTDDEDKIKKRLSNSKFLTIEDLVIANAMQGIHGAPEVYQGTKIDEEMNMYVDWYCRAILDNYFVEVMSKI